MKKTFLFGVVAVMLTLILPGCAVNLNGVAANYTPMDNYFVNNNFRNGTQKLVIHNQHDFEQVFGAAAVMGRNGHPTTVNFDHQFVVAVILPETNRQTSIETVMLNRVGDRLYYSYLISEGHKTSYTIRPFTAVVVSRNEPSDVVFQQVTPSDLERAGIRYNGSSNRPGTSGTWRNRN